MKMSGGLKITIYTILIMGSILTITTYTSGLTGDIITLNPSITYQKMTGWEMVAQAGQDDSSAFPNYQDQLFDKAVNEAGINRLRLEIKSGAENTTDSWSQYQAGIISYQTFRCLRYSTINDDNDPFNINWNGFQFAWFDSAIDKIVLPIKQKIEANGEKLHINLNYVAFTGQMRQTGCPSGLQYIHNNPDEYAELVLATYLHMQTKYGFVPDTWEVILEPDLVSEWTNKGNLIGQAIVAAANRLKANGFTPHFILPSTTSMANAVPYFDQAIQVVGALQYISEISYHRYGGATLGNLQNIANRAAQYNIGGAMLEWWNSANSYQTLHQDIKIGRNSAWQQGTVGGLVSNNPPTALYVIDDTNPSNPIITMGSKTRFTRQYYKFIRKGAVRIEAASNNTAFDPLAFINTNGGCVVVVNASTGGSFSLQGLPVGTYGIFYTTATQYDINLPDVTINANQALTTDIPAAGVLTVYAKSGGASDTVPPSPPQNLTVNLEVSLI